AVASKVSPVVQQLLVFFCIALLFSSATVRPAEALTAPIVRCLGSCSAFADCKAACISNNYPKGGICMGFGTQPPACCCYIKP
ncbi:hypothetical protein ABKV19_018054, partial [Rosa sericea]